jgi:hypothetical protein
MKVMMVQSSIKLSTITSFLGQLRREIDGWLLGLSG